MDWSRQDNFVSDNGWGFTAFEGADQIIPERSKLLKNRLAIPGLVCMSEGNVYVFVTSMNTWFLMCSPEAVTFVNNIIKSENATVQFNNAFRPYASFLEREACTRVARDIPVSICIGTERLKVSRDHDSLILSRCDPLLDYPAGEKKILSRLCYMPLYIRGWPKTWKKTSNFPLYKFLAPLFVDPLELTTIEWSVGHALIDPHSYSKTVILFGKGGHGKTTVMNLLTSSLMGCCGTIPDKSLVGLNVGLTQEVAAIVASNRIVTAGDVGGADRNTNLTVIKTLTGHDFINVGPARARTACTLFYASNCLDDPMENEEWATPAIMRRVVVVLMNAEIENFSDRIPNDQVSKLDFVLRCVHTRLSYPYMPVSPLSVLCTIMGSRVGMVSKYLAPVANDDGMDEDVMTANMLVASVMGLPLVEIGELANKISSYCTRKIDGDIYIRNIVPTDVYYRDIEGSSI